MGEVESGGPAAKPVAAHTPQAGDSGARRRPAREANPLAWALSSVFNLRAGRASYQDIRRRFVNGSKLSGTHLCILIVAMLIASIGLNTDSTECIVGAMLICPLMGSVLAISYSVATADVRLLRDALVGLLIQVCICLATSTLYFVLSPLNGVTNELLANSNPTVWDILVALAGGFAGGLGNSRRQEPSTLIAGVAVATALMPPLCAAGYGIAVRDPARFASAFYEFALNVVFIALAAEIVLLILRVPLHREVGPDGVVTLEEEVAEERLSRRMKRFILVATVVFMIPCVLATADMVRQATGPGAAGAHNVDEYQVGLTTRELSAVCPSLLEYRVGTEYVGEAGSATARRRVVATVRTSAPLDATQRSRLRALIRVHVKNLDGVTFEVARG
ncbi:DUF389 domain-containing protein [Parafannyhessea umbonata]|uniref:DUF389 domain-containing protein n=1 Tax=Parafannyhessea umbonata TaxID=604330 RepID=UPI003AB20B11